MAVERFGVVRAEAGAGTSVALSSLSSRHMIPFRGLTPAGGVGQAEDDRCTGRRQISFKPGSTAEKKSSL